MKIKKLVFLVLTVLLVFSALSVNAAQNYGTVNHGVTWKIDGTTLVIGGSGDIWGYDVKSTDRPWQAYNDMITKVIIKNGITSIGPYTFYGMDSLLSIETGDTIEEIYENSIGNCPSLCEVYFPKSITSIWGPWLENCPKAVLYIRPGGFAEGYAKQNGLKYFYGGMIYAPNGETKVVADYQLPVYLNSGKWSKDKSVAYVTMYADDGRKTEVKVTEVEAFKNVGWSLHKKYEMYSLDGRTLKVIESEIELYKTVGWYATKEEVIYINANRSSTALVEQGKYKEAVVIISDAIDELKDYPLGKPYSYWLKQKCKTAASKWSETIKCPLGYETSYTQKYDGGSSVIVTVRNLSEKTIKGFKLNFKCYDATSKLITTNSSFYYCDNITLNPLEAKSFKWNFNGKDVVSIRGIMITQVDYTDGEVWK